MKFEDFEYDEDGAAWTFGPDGKPVAFVCPSCLGRKKSVAHVNLGPDESHVWRELSCDTCSGTGVITFDQKHAREVGRGIRFARIAARTNLREMATRIGVDFVELSRAENGRLAAARTRELFALAEAVAMGGVA